MLGIIMSLVNLTIRSVSSIIDYEDNLAAKKRARNDGKDYYFDCKGRTRLLSNDHIVNIMPYYGIGQFKDENLKNKTFNGDSVVTDITEGNVIIRNYTAEKRGQDYYLRREKAKSKGKTVFYSHFITKKIPYEYTDGYYTKEIDIYEDIKTGEYYTKEKYKCYSYYADMNGKYVRPTDTEEEVFAKFLRNPKTDEQKESRERLLKAFKELKDGTAKL